MARRTQAIIMEAFIDLLTQKPLDKITVKDIIERADINRNTFYYYYENIPTLMDALFEQEITKFAESTDKSDSFAKEYMRASALVRENRLAIYHLYHSEYRERLSQYLESAAELFIEQFVRKAATPYALSEEGIYYVTHFYSYAVVGLTIHVIRENMPSTGRRFPEQLERTFYDSVDDVIRSYMQFSQNGITAQPDNTTAEHVVAQ